MLSDCTTGSISVTAGVPDHSIEDLLAERGIIVSREAIRLWCIKFGAKYARIRKRPTVFDLPIMSRMVHWENGHKVEEFYRVFLMGKGGVV
jgi:hypothetical protein